MVTRSAVLIAVVVSLGGVSQIPSPIALASHTTTADVTPVPPGYQFGPTTTPWDGGMPTATPTLQTTIDGSFINPPNGGMSGQPPAGGASVQSGSGVPGQQYPAGTGQQSVPSNQYPTITVPGTAPSGGLPGSINVTGSPAPSGSDPCYGDELISFAPESPRVGNEFLIAVTSAHQHPYGRLAGTEKTNFVRERRGQSGFVWEWMVQPTYPGQHEYTFYVDSTVPCQKIRLRVLDSLATKTPTPTKTATPWGWDNGNSNENGNGNTNTNDNYAYDPTPTAVQFNPTNYLGPDDRYGCRDFESQAQAQAVLRADPSDPNRLDANPRDGFACGGIEAAQDGVAGGMMPAPFDTARVARP